ncbi:energy-coupling factor transporter transmembrane protein EcfT [Herbiconiux sp. L3-i23]|uniref:energy-coupling factor transporter transmembrane component T family protein n=1 Tax=Herbiconiux sp. L3-i23 TaxID=2905871 RepID=UPI0020476592|nr:energy-coupling factor transporter transmembrane component T [Herbiconiux sp. L3-i23]BDI24007.1 putative HMP/thiamine permease protein YkoC [Herbiconiux sp. L3-i23]
MSATTIDPFADRYDAAPIRFLYRLNPLAKIAAPLPAMVALLFSRDPVTPAAFIALAWILLLVGASLSRRAALAIFLLLPLGIAVLSGSFALWTDPAAVAETPVLWSVGDYRFHLGALYIGASTALRLAALATLALLGGLTTTGPDLVRAMIQQLRVPYRIGYTTLAAYRFVPRFAHELDVIRAAHRVRGMAGGRGPVPALRRWVGYVVPLLASAIRHAERVALSMDSRAFGAHPTRTERHLVPFRTRDYLFVIAFWAVTATLFLAASSAEIPPIGVR